MLVKWSGTPHLSLTSIAESVQWNWPCNPNQLANVTYPSSQPKRGLITVGWKIIRPPHVSAIGSHSKCVMQKTIMQAIQWMFHLKYDAIRSFMIRTNTCIKRQYVRSVSFILDRGWKLEQVSTPSANAITIGAGGQILLLIFNPYVKQRKLIWLCSRVTKLSLHIMNDETT